MSGKLICNVIMKMQLPVKDHKSNDCWAFLFVPFVHFAMKPVIRKTQHYFPSFSPFYLFFIRFSCYSCGVKWDGTGIDPMLHISYVFYIYMFGFIIPVSIILTCYVKIIKTIKFTVGDLIKYVFWEGLGQKFGLTEYLLKSIKIKN